MKLREDLVLRQVAKNSVVFPVGDATVDFNGMLALNETGAFLWNLLKNGADTETLAKALTEEYEVEYTLAMKDAEQFIEKLQAAGCFETK